MFLRVWVYSYNRFCVASSGTLSLRHDMCYTLSKIIDPPGVPRGVPGICTKL